MDKITIHTELPIKKSETLVTIAFAYGFLNEADSLFGVGHLIEHCLCSQIKKKLKPKHVWGHIDDRTLVINILLSNFAFESLFKQGIVQTVLKIGKSINSKDIAIEKRRIKSEVEDRYSLPIPFLSQYIRNHLIKEPKRLARWRTDQVKNLHTLTTNKITKALEDIFSTRHSVFVGTSDKNKQINSKIKPLSKKLSIVFSEKKQIKLGSNKNKSAFVIAFRVPGIDKPLEQSFSVGFLSGEIYKSFRELANLNGVHEVYYEYRADREFGIVWFGMYSNTEISKDIDESFFKILNEAIEGVKLEKSLIKYKKEKIKSIKKDWADKIERQDWIVDDYLDKGEVVNLPSVLHSLNQITTTKINSVAGNVFSRNKAYVFKQ